MSKITATIDTPAERTVVVTLPLTLTLSESTLRGWIASCTLSRNLVGAFQDVVEQAVEELTNGEDVYGVVERTLGIRA